MNYIKQLQSDNEIRGESLRSVRNAIDEFISHLHSDKFRGHDSDGDRKDWISTADVINALREIKQSSYSDLA